ncbi:MAG: RimJ/RimL family protein N-acetyltransferase [Psychroserpens sp.]|jgi:RimJ/RimL family protein N-acetyltransferase
MQKIIASLILKEKQKTNMIKLEPFTTKDFLQLIHWINSERELVQFAGPLFTFPLTEDQLKTYINKEKIDPKKIIDIESGEVIGHCELNFSNKVPRLSRILIGDKKFRGKGLGTQIIELMIAEIQNIQPTYKVDLKVFRWNEKALQLYERTGFIVEPEYTYEYKYKDDEFWTSLHMSKCLNKS